MNTAPVRIRRKVGEIDRRKFNTPPKIPAIITQELVQAIDDVIAKGMTQRWIAKQLGVHDNTVKAVWNRTGAYKGYPKT